tara:strand:- start:351 stop:608 length:258 start_codon:yes stop_codon:yes gene_type:complete
VSAPAICHSEVAMQVSNNKWQSMKMHLPLLEQHFFDVQQLFPSDIVNSFQDLSVLRRVQNQFLTLSLLIENETQRGGVLLTFSYE